MALVSTMPAKGQDAKVYDIPDSELAKFQAVEGQQTPYDDAKDKIADGAELAGGIDLDKADVQAYGHVCVCYFWWGGRWWYRYQYCWQHCP